MTASDAKPARLRFVGQTDLEGTLAVLEPIATGCPQCGGDGWYLVPVCCGRAHGWECCGDPEPGQQQCQCGAPDHDAEVRIQSIRRAFREDQP